MEGLSIFHWILIVVVALASFVLQVAIILKFWRMCNDINTIKLHLVKDEEVGQHRSQNSRKEAGQVTGYGWFLIAVFGVLILLLLILANPI